MKKRKKQKFRVPKTKIKVGRPLQFNLAAQIRAYFIAKRCETLCKEKNLETSATWFNGLIRGYDEWFAVLHVDQDAFDKGLGMLSHKEMNADAEVVVTKLEKEYKKKKPLIEIPGVSMEEMQKIRENMEKNK